MRTRFWARKASLLALSLVVFSASAAPALADDTAEEIRLLKEQIKKIAPLTQRLKQLEEKVAKQEREKKELRAQTRNAGGNARLATKDGGERPPLPFFVDLSHGLSVESLDHADFFHLGGRIFVDGGGSTMPEKGLSEAANLAQARLQVEGRLRNFWEYKFQYDFVGGSNTTTVGAVGGIRDAYVALKYPGFRPPFLANPIEIQVGNFYLPHGMERSATSKNYIDFIERSLMSDTFGASRHVGIALLDHGSNWFVKAALSSTSVEDATLKPAAETPVPYWVPQNQNWVATGGRQYFDITARASYAPIWTEDRLLHFGASGRYHNPGDSTAANDDRVMNLGANTAMESNILKESLLGTPDLSCGANPSGLLGTAPGVAGGGVPSPVFGTQIAGTTGAGKCVKDVLGLWRGIFRRLRSVFAAGRVYGRSIQSERQRHSGKQRSRHSGQHSLCGQREGLHRISLVARRLLALFQRLLPFRHVVPNRQIESRSLSGRQ